MPIDENGLEGIKYSYGIDLPRGQDEGPARVDFLLEILRTGWVTEQLKAGNAYVRLLHNEPETVSAQSFAILLEAIKEGCKTPSAQKWYGVHNHVRDELRALREAEEGTNIIPSGVLIDQSPTLPGLIFAGVLHEITYPGSKNPPSLGETDMKEAVGFYIHLLERGDERISPDNIVIVSAALAAQSPRAKFMGRRDLQRDWEKIEQDFDSALQASRWAPQAAAPAQKLADIARVRGERPAQPQVI